MNKELWVNSCLEQELKLVVEGEKVPQIGECYIIKKQAKAVSQTLLLQFLALKIYQKGGFFTLKTVEF